jgi:hypothetical protein
VEKADLPLLARLPELLLEPLELRGIYTNSVQHKEPDVAILGDVVTLADQVKQLEAALARIVMIAQRVVKGYGPSSRSWYRTSNFYR